MLSVFYAILHEIFFNSRGKVFKNSFLYGTPPVLLKMAEEFLKNSNVTLKGFV